MKFVSKKICKLQSSWLQDGSFASEEWLIENKEVPPTEYAKKVAAHPDWPKYAANGSHRRKLTPVELGHEAFRLHCEWLLGKENTRDAIEWLNQAKANACAIGALSATRARKIVSEALDAGARRVLAADTYASEKGKEFADVLLVELPKLKAKRAASGSPPSSLMKGNQTGRRACWSSTSS
jgi:hypothetical protein